jgi:hypothetical protein
MSSPANHAACLPTPIALRPSWSRRTAHAARDALDRLSAWRRRRTEARSARRQAALHHALISQLDAATLRDLGLGDWVAAHGAGRWIDVDRF